MFLSDSQPVWKWQDSSEAAFTVPGRILRLGELHESEQREGWSMSGELLQRECNTAGDAALALLIAEHAEANESEARS